MTVVGRLGVLAGGGVVDAAVGDVDVVVAVIVDDGLGVSGLELGGDVAEGDLCADVLVVVLEQLRHARVVGGLRVLVDPHEAFEARVVGVGGEVVVVEEGGGLEGVLDDVEAVVVPVAHAGEDGARAARVGDAREGRVNVHVVLENVAQQEGPGVALTIRFAGVVDPNFLAHGDGRGGVTTQRPNKSKPGNVGKSMTIVGIGMIHCHHRLLLCNRISIPIKC